MMFMVTAFSAASIQNPEPIKTQKNQVTSISWDVTMNFNNPGGQTDNVVFGEAPDAHDGPPADTYDIPKPPAPMPPYIRTYLKDNLPIPYNTLWKDYRQYPDTQKTWNVSIQWYPEDTTSPTTITMTWSTAAVHASEYSTVNLCTTTGTVLKNMLVDTTYTFSCPALTPQNFQIICSQQQQNLPPNKPNTPSGTASGKIKTVYTYTTSTTDPNNDQVYYMWDWGDGTQSGWLGPYTSGVTTDTTHTWTVKGSYSIKVKAKDIFGAESPWSDPLPIKMPTSQNGIVKFIDFILSILRGEQRGENLLQLFRTL
jgi:hypothetical protein